MKLHMKLHMNVHSWSTWYFCSPKQLSSLYSIIIHGSSPIMSLGDRSIPIPRIFCLPVSRDHALGCACPSVACMICSSEYSHQGGYMSFTRPARAVVGAPSASMPPAEYLLTVQRHMHTLDDSMDVLHRQNPRCWPP